LPSIVLLFGAGVQSCATLLGLSPSELQAVQTEHTKVLPGLPGSAAR
jgi:hypothetical protein